MSDNKTTEEWVVERCSKPFESQEDVTYMKKKKFDGMVLKLEDGSIQRCQHIRWILSKCRGFRELKLNLKPVVSYLF